MPTPWFLIYPVLVLPMLMIGFSIGLVLSTVGQVAKDLVPIVLQVVSLLMFVTPVVYLQSSGQTGVLGKIVEFNPLTYLVSFPRDLITSGESTQIVGFLLALLLVTLVFLFAIHLFYLLVDLVAERL
jgi:lipopolysaccharide transport system permease protein